MNYSESPLQQMKLVVSTHAKQQFYERFNSAAVDIDCANSAIKQLVRSGDVFDADLSDPEYIAVHVKNCDFTFVTSVKIHINTVVIVTCYPSIEVKANAGYSLGCVKYAKLCQHDRRKRAKKAKKIKMLKRGNVKKLIAYLEGLK